MIINITLVVLICIVFVLVFLFLNTVDKRKWLTFLVSLVLTPIVYFYMVYPMINIFSSYHHQKYFKAELWKENPELRYEISDDMIDSEVLMGKTKTEIISLLGTYEWLGWNDALKKHNDNKWNYSLGIEPGAFNTKKECIELVFKNDKVVAINLFKDTIKFDD